MPRTTWPGFDRKHAAAHRERAGSTFWTEAEEVGSSAPARHLFRDGELGASV